MSDKVKASTTLTFKDTTDSESTESISVSIHQDDNNGKTSGFLTGTDMFLRVYSRNAVTVKKSTLGNVSIVSFPLYEEKEAVLEFRNTDKETLSEEIDSVESMSWVGKSPGNVTYQGDGIFGISQPGLGVLKVTYKVKYTKLRLSGVPQYSSDEFDVLVYVKDSEGREGFSTVGFGSEEGAEPEDTYITVRDFQSDIIIVGAKVWVDGQYLGTTDSFGQVYAGKLIPGQKYDLKITASGYKDSDEDALRNDSFII